MGVLLLFVFPLPKVLYVRDFQTSGCPEAKPREPSFFLLDVVLQCEVVFVEGQGDGDREQAGEGRWYKRPRGRRSRHLLTTQGV